MLTKKDTTGVPQCILSKCITHVVKIETTRFLNAIISTCITDASKRGNRWDPECICL